MTAATGQPTDGVQRADAAEPGTVLSIVVPMYREANRIGPSIMTLAASPLNRPGIEFVFVDDGSPDDTSSVAATEIEAAGLLGARVLRLCENQGKGGAVRAGMLASSGAVVGFVDADLSLDPVEVDRALAVLTSSGADLVVGHRMVDAKHQPVMRRAASLAFRVVTAAFAPTGVADSQCALKLFHRQHVLSLFGPLRTTGFGFDVEVLVRARRAGLRVAELPIAWTHQDGSKVDPVRDGLAMFREVTRIRRLARATSVLPVPVSSVMARPAVARTAGIAQAGALAIEAAVAVVA
jgi:dolichyl-phosphate beta-glucosyltransferase